MQTVEELIQSLEAIILVLEDKAVRSTDFDDVVEIATELKEDLEELLHFDDEA